MITYTTTKNLICSIDASKSENASPENPSQTNSRLGKRVTAHLYWDIENVQIPNKIDISLALHKMRLFANTLAGPLGAAILQISSTIHNANPKIMNTEHWLPAEHINQGADIAIEESLIKTYSYHTDLSYLCLVLLTTDHGFIPTVQKFAARGANIVIVYHDITQAAQFRPFTRYLIDIRLIMCISTGPSDPVKTQHPSSDFREISLQAELGYRLMCVAYAAYRPNSGTVDYNEVARKYKQLHQTDIFKFSRLITLAETEGFVTVHNRKSTLQSSGMCLSTNVEQFATYRQHASKGNVATAYASPAIHEADTHSMELGQLVNRLYNQSVVPGRNSEGRSNAPTSDANSQLDAALNDVNAIGRRTLRMHPVPVAPQPVISSLSSDKNSRQQRTTLQSDDRAADVASTVAAAIASPGMTSQNRMVGFSKSVSKTKVSGLSAKVVYAPVQIAARQKEKRKKKEKEEAAVKQRLVNSRLERVTKNRQLSAKRGFCYLLLFAEVDKYHIIAKDLGRDPIIHAVLAHLSPLQLRVFNRALVLSGAGHFHVVESEGAIIDIEAIRNTPALHLCTIGSWSREAHQNAATNDALVKSGIQPQSTVQHFVKARVPATYHPSFGDGYCYLLLAPDHIHTAIASELGSWPTCNALVRALIKFGIDLTTILKVRLTQVEKGRYHLTRDSTRRVSISDLCNTMLGHHKLGGYLAYGKVYVRPAPFMGTLSIIATVTKVLYIMCWLLSWIVNYFGQSTFPKWIGALVTLINVLHIDWLFLIILTITAATIVRQIFRLRPTGRLMTRGNKVTPHSYFSQDAVLDYFVFENDDFDPATVTRATVDVSTHPKHPKNITPDPSARPEETTTSNDQILNSIVTNTLYLANASPAVTGLDVYHTREKMLAQGLQLTMPNISYATPHTIERQCELNGASVSVPNLQSVMQEERMSAELRPIVIQHTLGKRPDALFQCVLEVFRLYVKLACITDATALVYNDDPIRWPLNGFYHCWGDRSCIPTLRHCPSLEHLHPLISEGRCPTVYKATIIDCHIHVNHLIFLLTQYQYDIKYLAHLAHLKGCNSILIMEFSSLSLLTDMDGILTKVGLKWRVVAPHRKRAVQYIEFSSIEGAAVLFVLRRDLVLQYMMSTQIEHGCSYFIKRTLRTYGDVQLTEYFRSNSPKLEDSIMLTNSHAQHYKGILIPRGDGWAFSGGVHIIQMMPIHTANKAVSSARDNTRLQVSNTSSQLSTMRTTYETYVSDPQASDFISLHGDLTEIAQSVINVAHYLKTANNDTDSHELLLPARMTITEYLHMYFSDEYRLKAYAANLSHLLWFSFEASRNVRPLRHSCELLMATLHAISPTGVPIGDENFDYYDHYIFNYPDYESFVGTWCSDLVDTTRYAFVNPVLKPLYRLITLISRCMFATCRGWIKNCLRNLWYYDYSEYQIPETEMQHLDQQFSHQNEDLWLSDDTLQLTETVDQIISNSSYLAGQAQSVIHIRDNLEQTPQRNSRMAESERPHIKQSKNDQTEPHNIEVNPNYEPRPGVHHAMSAPDPLAQVSMLEPYSDRKPEFSVFNLGNQKEKAKSDREIKTNPSRNESFCASRTDAQSSSFSDTSTVTSEMTTPDELVQSFRTPLSLGRPMCEKTFDMLLDLRNFTSVTTELGQLYNPTNNSLVECVFKCPKFVHERVKAVHPDHVFDYHACLLALARCIVVRNNLYIGEASTVEDVKTSVIIKWQGSHFVRLVPADNDKFHKLLEDYIKVDGGLKELSTLATGALEDVPAGGCFFHATGLAGTGIATRLQIHNHAVNDNVGIFYNKKFYSATPAVRTVIYVQNNHAMKLSIQVLPTLQTYYPQEPHTHFPLALDGTIDASNTILERLAELRSFELRVNASLGSASSRLKSVIEAVTYNVVIERALLRRFASINEDNPLTSYRAITDVAIYDTHIGKFLNEAPQDKQVNCWSNGMFQSATYNPITRKFSCVNPSRYMYFSPDISFLRERQLLDRVMPKWNDILAYDFAAIQITLHQGVPGCGKTYSITKDHNPGVDLVCTATSGGRSEYVHNIQGDLQYYRTYDSIMLNGAPNCATMYADEGLMVHAGELLLVAWIAKVSTMHVHGDTMQIPFINRANAFAVSNHLLDVSNVVPNLVTRRNPQSMMPVLRQFYPGISSMNASVGILEKQLIRSTLQVPPDFDAYLVFTQAEKKLLPRIPKEKIFTIHEAQGANFESVALIRVLPQNNPIYDSQPHVIVGITRHKVRLKYFTVIEQDTTWNVLSGKVVDLTEELVRQKAFQPLTIKAIEPPLSTTLRVVKRCTMFEPADEEFLEWILHQTAHTEATDTKYVQTTHTTLLPQQIELIDDVDHAYMQEVYDAIFEPVIEEERIALHAASVYPLEPDFKVDTVKLLSSATKRPTEYLTPRVRTVQPWRDSGGAEDAVTSVRKRNLDPPIIQYLRPPGVINDVADCFMRTYVDENKLLVHKDTMNFSSQSHTRAWYNSRTGTRRKMLKSLPKRDYSEVQYPTHNRPDIKPPLTNAHNYERAVTQVVTAHPPAVTAKYAGMGAYTSQILKASLQPQWCINDGINADQLNGHINYILQSGTTMIPQEIDFSKYDKSQEELCLQVVLEILRRLGVAETVVLQWEEAHKLNVLTFHSLGLSIKTKYQRRSGDALTFIGNTILLMAILAYAHDYTQAYGGVFGGDDSLVFLYGNYPLTDQSGIIAQIFNMTAKVENFPDAPYFASKLLIHVQQNYYLVPDPIKAITRLGKHDMYCKEHVELAWISFADNFRCYLNPDIRLAACIAACNRIQRVALTKIQDITIFGDFLAYLVSNKTAFVNLFEGELRLMQRPLPKALKEEIGRQQSRQLGILGTADLATPFDEEYLIEI